MITSPVFRGKRYAVLGLARSGLATVRALLASGAEVVAWDEREEARRELLQPSPLQGRGTDDAQHRQGEGETGASLTPPLSRWLRQLLPLPLRRGVLSFADPLTLNLNGFDGVVVSPGVPLNTHPIAPHARAAGVPVIGDIELFALARPSLPPHKVVGITGTNGKSTTTALIHHVLSNVGIPATMGGNIGLPILGQDPLPEGGVYVLELSSYQIDLTFSLDCDVAVLLNVTPDHLDRYENFKAYRDSKLRLFSMQSPDHWSILAGAAFDDELRCDVMTSETGPNRLVTALEGIAKLRLEQSAWPALQGPHNAENAWAALQVARRLGIQKRTSKSKFRTYPGLPHRMERIRELDGVLYVNDSKATNADSCAPALAAYPALHWILGGKAKTKELDACAPHFGHVCAAYTIGEAGPMFADLLRPHMPVTESITLDVAVQDARKAAKAGETVLLSPACASFDQFRDFEARGDAFRAAVEALA